MALNITPQCVYHRVAKAVFEHAHFLYFILRISPIDLEASFWQHTAYIVHIHDILFHTLNVLKLHLHVDQKSHLPLKYGFGEVPLH